MSTSLSPNQGTTELAQKLADVRDLIVASVKMPPVTLYFCGVWPNSRNEGGHYAYLPGGRRVYATPGGEVEISPWGGDGMFSRDPVLDGLVAEAMAPRALDGGARRAEPEGLRFHFQKNGWTMVSWWDRSGDPRGASVAGFVMKGLYTANEAEAYARKMFPTVFERMDLHLGRTPQAEVLRDRVVRALAEAPQSAWEEIARLLRVG